MLSSLAFCLSNETLELWICHSSSYVGNDVNFPSIFFQFNFFSYLQKKKLLSFIKNMKYNFFHYCVKFNVFCIVQPRSTHEGQISLTCERYSYVSYVAIFASQGLRSALLIFMSRADRNPWLVKMLWCLIEERY
jgi:hypothetical protein